MFDIKLYNGGKIMNKYPLIGGSICAVVLIVLASLTNVVGYQTIQSSNQKMITSEIDQKELLFQTIVDMSNNKEIQRVILGSELTEKQFYNHNMRFSAFTFPVITDKFIKQIYTMGVLLFRTLSKSKIQSLINHHQVMNQEMQNELSVVIQKNPSLKGEFTQLSNLKCDCEQEKSFLWPFPVYCTILLILYNFCAFWQGIFDNLSNQFLIFLIPWTIAYFILFLIWGLAASVWCWWAGPYPP